MDPMIKLIVPALLLAFCVTASAATLEENYMRNCAVCHLPGIHGAPKVGDKAEWTQRIRPGISTVYRNAIKGIPNTAMMAKGGHDDLSDGEIKAIVDYMIAAAAIEPAVLRDAAPYDALAVERERVAIEVADETLVGQVRKALARIREVDLPNTKVEAERGVVSVVGIVPTPQVVKQAYGAVKRIPGIKKIDMRLVSGHQMGWD